MSAEESGSGSEAEAYLEDAGTDDGEDNEDFGVDAGLELDGVEEGSDSEEEEDTSEEEEGDDDASSRDANEDAEDEEPPGPPEETPIFPSHGEATTASANRQPEPAVQEANVAATISQTPTENRKLQFRPSVRHPRSYVVDAICALPHPVPTNAIAASLCMSHLLTGSEDGYIRNYDIFTACNGKNFLSAPQRSHCGFVEGVIKAGVLRSWWESTPPPPTESTEAIPKESVHSLLAQSDSLWGLSGLERGNINLFTIRHDPGRIIHTFTGHKGPVGSLAMSPDEKSFFSAGWDGEILHWDLSSGIVAERFPAQGAQMSVVALRPLKAPVIGGLTSFGQSTAPFDSLAFPTETIDAPDWIPGNESAKAETTAATAALNEPSQLNADDAKSDTSYDPLFDAEPDAELDNQMTGADSGSIQPKSDPYSKVNSQSDLSGSGGKLEGVPFAQGTRAFDQTLASSFSYDIVLTAAIDGQLLLWDRRSAYKHVGRLPLLDKCPPWCVSACWSADGTQIYAGRRNGTVDIWDVRRLGIKAQGVPHVLRTLRNPASSGEVSCVAAFPDGKHLACASHDNIRLWNVYDYDDTRSKGAQFKIITGHHGGQVSQILIDSAARFMVSASGNRGWFGESTRTVLVHDVKAVL